MARTFHCMFEQSGTFKNEFKKLGYNAYDYDILNDFGETDNVIDLYAEIEKSYGGGKSIFDTIETTDMVLAFFPCIRFENQILLWFNGQAKQQKKWSLETKLLKDLELHKELSYNYELITKLVIICLRKNIPLIIENPYSEQHYLTRYWALKPKYIDYDRTLTGDFMKKPTQFFFVNCEPKHNFIFEGVDIKKKVICNSLWGHQVQRSMISKDYANRFIREFILESENENE